MKPGYKQTDVGLIPEDWCAKRIGEDIDLLTGFPFPSSGYVQTGVRLLRGSNVKRGLTDWAESITEYWPALTPEIVRYELRIGDLVISMDGSLVGRSFARLRKEDLPAVLLQRVARIRSKKMDVSYLSAFVGSDRFIKYVDSVKTVTAIPHISPSDIANFAIPVPPTIEEQRAIAEALSDVDGLLGALERLIAKKRDLKQAAMQQLLTGQTRLPGFRGEWEVKRLPELAEIRSGGTPSTSASQFWDGNIPWCTPTDITALDGHKYLSETSRMITAQGLNASSAEMIPAFSIVMTSRATIGECAINKVPVSTNQGFKNFVPFDTTEVEFLYYLLLMQKSGFIGLCGGSTFLEIGKAQLSSYSVRIPKTKAEQTAIAQVLSNMDAELSALERRRNKTRALKQGMMQELLTGRTRLV